MSVPSRTGLYRVRSAYGLFYVRLSAARFLAGFIGSARCGSLRIAFAEMGHGPLFTERFSGVLCMWTSSVAIRSTCFTYRGGRFVEEPHIIRELVKPGAVALDV